MYGLRVLGGFALEGQGGAVVPRLPQRRAEAVLAVLAVCGDLGCTRERLIAMLWPESDEAHSRHGLRDALHAIRNALGKDAVVSEGDLLRLHPEVVGSDVGEFRRALSAGQRAEAVRVCGGPLLDGLHVDGAPEFERWLDGERSRLARECVEAIVALARDADASGNAAEAADWWARAVEHDPLNSHSVLRHAEALAAIGDRANALKVADIHVRRLREELDLEPDKAVLERIQRIRNGEPVTPPDLVARSREGAPAAGRPPGPADSAPEATGNPNPPVRRASGAASPRRHWSFVGLVSALVLVIAVAAVADRSLRFNPLTIAATDLVQVTNAQGLQWWPAISPDGKAVAYVAGGGGGGCACDSAYVAVRGADAALGSAELRLSDTSLPYTAAPTWAPDGGSVRFWSRSGQWWFETSRFGGVPHVVASPCRGGRISPGVSPDGGRVAFGVGDTLFVARVADSTQRRIAVHPFPSPKMPHSFAWSPDGRLIAYVYSTGSEFAGTLQPSSIWVVSAGGGAPRAVTDTVHANLSPAWLDDRHLLFVSDRDGALAVYVVEVGPSGPRGAPRSVPGVADPYSISYAIGPHELAWAKVAQRLYIWSYPLGRRAAISIRDGQHVTTGNEMIESGDVSPDGRWLVFSSARPGGTLLYRMPVSGGEAVPLTDTRWSAWGPRWSPNGSEIAFFASQTGTSMSVERIMTVPAAGGEPVALAGEGDLSNDPAWSPDGFHIAFQSNRTGRWEAWLLSRDSVGGAWHHPVPLTHTGCFVRDWAPDGSGVLCSYFGPPVLRLVSPEGRVLWRRDLAPFGLVYAQFARFSRDGKTIYVDAGRKDGSRGIWTMPTSGGAPRLVITDDAPGAFPVYPKFSVGRDRLFLPVREVTGNVWVAKLSY